jgi:hypothetical protein
VSFAPSELPSGTTSSDVVIYTAPAGSNAFTSLGGTLVDPTHVQATTTHFSQVGAVVRIAGRPDGGNGADGGNGSDAGQCTYGSGGGADASCLQVVICPGSPNAYARCSGTGVGSCSASDGGTFGSPYSCVCGTPPYFTSTGGLSCAVTSDGGLTGQDCLHMCGFP